MRQDVCARFRAWNLSCYKCVVNVKQLWLQSNKLSKNSFEKQHVLIYIFLSLCSRTYPRRGGRRRVGRRHRSLWVTKTQETHTKTQTSHTKTPCAYWTNFEMSQVPFQLAKLHKVCTNPVYLRIYLLKKSVFAAWSWVSHSHILILNVCGCTSLRGGSSGEKLRCGW